jgi:Cu/Ag efflux protein CusF
MNHRSIAIGVASLLAALALCANAQQPSNETKVMTDTSPGQATMAQTRSVIATVEAIDMAQRQVTLKGPEGKVSTLTLGPEVRNLEQVKVGDRVKASYLEALSLTLKKGGKELPSASSAADGARAPAGGRPGGVAAQQVKVTADVIAVDDKTHMVTLRGPKQTVDLYVADPEQLKLIKVGDQVDAVYTQAVAVSVEPAQ